MLSYFSIFAITTFTKAKTVSKKQKCKKQANKPTGPISFNFISFYHLSIISILFYFTLFVSLYQEKEKEKRIKKKREKIMNYEIL